MRHIENIHFIGIGGSGMSGIAEVLLNQGYCVSGSDKANNAAVNRLRDMGARIFQEHAAQNIQDADVVVISSAITSDNVELQAAQSQRIPVLPRAQMLAELMRFHCGIAIAGTHGKTTTTSLTASILAVGGFDPTFVIGGLLNSVGSHAHSGKSNYFVVEADESDASFLYLNPTISVITNIDADHMQTYEHDFGKLKKAFINFVQRLPFYGVAIACVDDANVREILPQFSRGVVTYGFEHAADIQGINFHQDGWHTRFTVKRNNLDNAEPLDINLNLPGKHNALNALAAIAVATEIGVDGSAIQKALSEFGGTGRRLQKHGMLHLPKGKVLLLDDYGHHPQEIKVTIQALRAAWPNKRLILAFQPHRYTRTQALFDDFVKVLSEVDLLLLLDIYSAGEKTIAGVSGKSLARSIRQRGKIDPIFVADIQDLSKIIADIAGDDDVLLLQGAGSIGTVPNVLLANFPHDNASF